MKRISLAALLLAAACTKQYVEHPTCQRVYMLSDKYKLDSTYLHTDSLWPWGRHNNAFCNADTLIFYETAKPTPMRICADNQLEIIRFVVGEKLTTPTLFK